MPNRFPLAGKLKTSTGDLSLPPRAGAIPAPRSIEPACDYVARLRLRLEHALLVAFLAGALAGPTVLFLAIAIYRATDGVLW